MDKAYDKILQTIVTAKDAVLNRGFEPYRFECLRCGEEVHIAAPFSKKQSPHFRHLHGNSDVKCEEYSGLGIEVLSAKRNYSGRSGNAEVIFSRLKNAFQIRIKLTEEEISEYESQQLYFEISTGKGKDPFRKIPINRTNFAPSEYTSFVIDYFSDIYYLKIGEKYNRSYDFMTVDTPVFFRIYGDEEQYYAKRISGLGENQILYVGTKYLIVTLNPNRLKLYENIFGKSIYTKFEFQSIKGLTFYAMEILIEQKDDALENDLLSIGCRIEAGDEAILLWPPSFIQNDVLQCKADETFIYSSFQILPYCGNNLVEEELEEITPSITKVKINKDVRIIRKNTELQIKHSDRIQLWEKHYPRIKCCNRYNVSVEGITVLLDNDGVTCLQPGQTIHMMSGRVIKRIINNTVIEIVMPEEEKQISKEDIIREIELYYHIEQPLNEEDIQAARTEFAREYLRKNSERCNRAVITMIKEGLL